MSNRKRLSADDVHLAVLFVKGNLAVAESEEGMIATHADIFTWVETSATLAHDDVTRDDGLAAKLFDTKTLAVAIASVLGSSLSFFV